jgi:uncharacterized protein YbaR (Trm112 family)
LYHIKRILKKGSFCFLEFPNRAGIRNRMGTVKKAHENKNDYNSWDVRYYSIKEYKSIFKNIFNNFSFKNHSVLGIGILPNDLNYVIGLKNKLIVFTSLLLSKVASVVTPIKNVSDSIYIKSVKQDGETNADAIDIFKRSHKQNPSNNLNIVSLLRCPISGGPLVLDASETKLISFNANVFYPIVNGIPIVIKSQALSMAGNSEMTYVYNN